MISTQRWRPSHLLSILSMLPKAIRDYRPDVVFHFPYGTFRNHYGVANRAYMRRVDRICTRRNVPCVSVMYSIDESTNATKLSRSVSCLTTSEQDGWKGRIVESGLGLAGWPPEPASKADGHTLLFMAGMWEPSSKRLEHVLDVRGLLTLLEAGGRLAPRGVRLIVASPLFADDALRRATALHPGNAWPEEAIEFRTTVRTPDIYCQADLFVFPYRASINHFLPTSVVESMFAGTPVVISDVPLFHRLANDGVSAFVFDAGDADALAGTVLTALGDEALRHRVRDAARRMARERWSIENSARQLRAIAGDLLSGQQS
jgi:hypothetical protein